MMGYILYIHKYCSVSCSFIIPMCHYYSSTVELRNLQNSLFPNWLFLCDVIDLNAISLQRHQSESNSASYWSTRLDARASLLGCQLPLVASVRVVTSVCMDVCGVMHATEYCEWYFCDILIKMRRIQCAGNAKSVWTRALLKEVNKIPMFYRRMLMI